MYRVGKSFCLLNDDKKGQMNLTNRDSVHLVLMVLLGIVRLLNVAVVNTNSTQLEKYDVFEY